MLRNKRLIAKILLLSVIVLSASWYRYGNTRPWSEFGSPDVVHGEAGAEAFRSEFLSPPVVNSATTPYLAMTSPRRLSTKQPRAASNR